MNQAYVNTASDLLQQHVDTLVADNARWQTLIADDIVWELPYPRGIGHRERLSGREAVARHVTWFLAAVEKFRFSDVRLHVYIHSPSESRVTSYPRLYRTTSLISTSAFSSQYVISISRYIVVAVLTCSRACSRWPGRQ